MACCWIDFLCASFIFNELTAVSCFAMFYFQGEKIKYTSDPLEDFTLINFLNRFVYRNPKKTNSSGE